MFNWLLSLLWPKPAGWTLAPMHGSTVLLSPNRRHAWKLSRHTTDNVYDRAHRAFDIESAYTRIS